MFDVIELGGARAVKTPASTNHVYLVDVSGSMHRSLPSMRQHLKNIVSMITQPDDTFSIIYFSGRGQCGIVCEAVPVNDIGSVTSVQNAIDRWLQPIGLTGFFDPIRLAMDVVKNLPNDKHNNFVMLTDGYDNQSNRNDVVKHAQSLPDHFNSISFIEYGWYCDRELLAKMAEASGGVHVFAEGYDDYERRFDETISGAVRESRIEVAVNKRAKHVVYVHNGNIVIVEVADGGIVNVPESVDRVHSIVPKDVLQKELSDDHLYLILYYAAKTGNSKLVWRCLEDLGDIHLIDLYSNAFTRQEISAFLDSVQDCALNKNKRYAKGIDYDYLPSEDTPTVLDLLNVIDNGTGVGIVKSSPYFRYSRTTRATETEEELPRFLTRPESVAEVTGLVYNSTRPNVSIQTLIKGSVEVPENEFELKYVPSQQFRNYTVIRDGILNIKTLPVLVDSDTLDKLNALTVKGLVEVIEEGDDRTYVVINLEKLPVINRKMVDNIDKEKFVDTVRDLYRYQGAVKGLKGCLSKKDTKSEGLAEKYGKKAAEWLSSIGVRDYGFSKKGTSVEPTDAYIATEVSVKAKGLSALPSVNAVKKKLDAGKTLTVSEYLVNKGIDAGMVLKSDEDINDLLKYNQQKVKDLNFKLSQMIYTMIIGKRWFDGVDDEVMEDVLRFGDNEYTAPVKVSIERKEIKI